MLALSATACAGDPTPQRAPDDAATEVAGLLLLGEGPRTCIAEAFTVDPALAGIVNAGAGEQLSPSRITEAVRAVRGCAPQDELDRSLARLATAGSGDAACATAMLAELDDGEVDVLVAWALNANALDTADLLTFRGVAERLAVDCGVQLPGEVRETSPGEVPPGDGGDPGVSIGDGATSVSR